MNTQFFIDNAKWLIPLLLIVLKLTLKLLVASPFMGLELWKAIIQLPVDIGFLSLSFIAAAILRDPQASPGHFVTAICYLILLIISITIWKCSSTEVGRPQILKTLGLAIVNCSLTIWMLSHSIDIL